MNRVSSIQPSHALSRYSFVLTCLGTRSASTLVSSLSFRLRMPTIVNRTRNLLGYAGYSIPSIAFGTWKLGNGQGVIDQVDQALVNGFDHIGGVWALQEREPHRRAMCSLVSCDQIPRSYMEMKQRSVSPCERPVSLVRTSLSPPSILVQTTKTSTRRSATVLPT